MGGHGGLNILPQKSWNVYNWDNRERVRKDELEHAFNQEQEREQRLQNEREFRRQVLLKRAQRRAGGMQLGEPPPLLEPTPGSEARGAAHSAEEAPRQIVALPESSVVEHVTLFDEHDYEQHFGIPNEKAAKALAKEQAKKLLGREATNVEQKRAKHFEEQFRLGGSKTELHRVPWYARRNDEEALSEYEEDPTSRWGRRKKRKSEDEQLQIGGAPTPAPPLALPPPPPSSIATGGRAGERRSKSKKERRDHKSKKRSKRERHEHKSKKKSKRERHEPKANKRGASGGSPSS